MLLLGFICKWLILNPIFTNLGSTVAGAIPVIPALNFLYSVGRTIPTRWLFVEILASRASWVFPKIIANMIVCFTVSIFFIFALLAFSLLSISAVPAIIAKTICIFFMALFVGTLIPYTQQQPLSLPAGGFLLGVLFMLITFLTSILAEVLSQLVVPAIWLSFAMLFAFSFTALARKTTDSDV